jgi:hypothetical protein
MHGFAGWFDLDFCGSAETIHFSTAPECPGTHWYQCRLLFREPLAVNRGQFVSGTMRFQANEFFSYYIDMTARIDGTEIETKNRIHLKDQVSMFARVMVCAVPFSCWFKSPPLPLAFRPRSFLIILNVCVFLSSLCVVFCAAIQLPEPGTDHRPCLKTFWKEVCAAAWQQPVRCDQSDAKISAFVC